MLSRRVNRLLDAYFNSPVERYVKIVSGLTREGGLSAEEVTAVKTTVHHVHASTILRHIGTPSAGYGRATDPDGPRHNSAST